MHTNFENSANGSTPQEEAKCVTATAILVDPAPAPERTTSESVLLETLKGVGKAFLCTTPLGFVAATAWDSRDSISRLCTGKATCSKELIREVGSNAGKNACRAAGATIGKAVGRTALPGIGTVAGIALGGFLAGKFLSNVVAGAEKELDD